MEMTLVFLLEGKKSYSQMDNFIGKSGTHFGSHQGSDSGRNCPLFQGFTLVNCQLNTKWKVVT